MKSRFLGRRRHSPLQGFFWILGACLLMAGRFDQGMTGFHYAAAKDGHHKRPNIVFIVIDALRADRLAAYGNEQGLAPNIDRLAREGVVFEEAISQAPWTQPSMASVFSSYYPGVHRVLDYNLMVDAAYFGEKKSAVFDDSFVTLAEKLSGAGYQTAAFVANPFLLEQFGFAQGFDHYDAGFSNTSTSGAVLNESLLGWLEKRRDKRPLFLYLHYMDVHGPYNARPEILDPMLDEVEKTPGKRRLSDEAMDRLDYLRQPPAVHTRPERHVRLMRYREYWVARYNACVREADSHLRSLISSLDQKGIWDSALTILMADHGEELYEHNFWDHGNTLHHNELHVPLIMRWPGTLDAERRISNRVELIDLMPTLLEWMEIPPIERPVQGRSFLPLLQSEPVDLDASAFSEAVKSGPKRKAFYSGQWKIIHNIANEKTRLFNLDVDSHESENKVLQHQTKTQTMIERLRGVMRGNSELARGRVVNQVEVDQQDLNRFRALGYLR